MPFRGQEFPRHQTTSSRQPAVQRTYTRRVRKAEGIVRSCRRLSSRQHVYIIQLKSDLRLWMFRLISRPYIRLHVQSDVTTVVERFSARQATHFRERTGYDMHRCINLEKAKGTSSTLLQFPSQCV